jgi:hypothetical protein
MNIMVWLNALTLTFAFIATAFKIEVSEATLLVLLTGLSATNYLWFSDKTDKERRTQCGYPKV